MTPKRRTSVVMKFGFILSFFISIVPSFSTPAPQTKQVQPQDQPNIKILSDQMDCDQDRKVCIATGNAIAEKLGDSKIKVLKADVITAHFVKLATGPTKVSHLEATGNVIILLGDIIIQGDRGNYNTETEVAEVFNNVKVTNEENQLDGGYATVNMKKGHYTIKSQGDSNNGERVQARIVTSKDARNEND